MEQTNGEMKSKRFMSKYDGRKHGWLRFAKQGAVTALLIFIVFHFVLGAAFIKGDSMEPTLSDGNFVVYFRLDKQYERGDIVSIRMPSGDYYVKRIIAVEGDTVDIRGNQLFLNGALLQEPYIQGETFLQKNAVDYPYEVEQDSVFVMGDNRSDSIDSRVLGAIVCDQIKGTLLFVQ